MCESPAVQFPGAESTANDFYPEPLGCIRLDLTGPPPIPESENADDASASVSADASTSSSDPVASSEADKTFQYSHMFMTVQFCTEICKGQDMLIAAIQVIH